MAEFSAHHILTAAEAAELETEELQRIYLAASLLGIEEAKDVARALLARGHAKAAVEFKQPPADADTKPAKRRGHWFGLGNEVKEG